MARSRFGGISLVGDGGARLGGVEVGVFTDSGHTTLADLRGPGGAGSFGGPIGAVQTVRSDGTLIGGRFLGPDGVTTLYLGVVPGQGLAVTPSFTPSSVTAEADIDTPVDEGVVLLSPDSTEYRLVVADDGTLSTEAVV